MAGLQEFGKDYVSKQFSYTTLLLWNYLLPTPKFQTMPKTRTYYSND